jgi:hypothetical protein
LPLFYEHFTLKGRTTSLFLTDLSFGNSHLTYTSTSILFAGVMGGRDVLVLYGEEDEGYEAIIKLHGRPRSFTRSPRVALVDNFLSSDVKGTLISFLPGIRGVIEVWDSDTLLVLYCDRATAASFHAPSIPGPPADPFNEFWGIGTNSSVLIGGPYLVRSARLDGPTLALQGDIQGDTMLRLVGIPTSVRHITWNDMEIEGLTGFDDTPSIFTGILQAPQSFKEIKVPKLGPWKYRDSLPEINDSLEESEWIIASNTTTNSPYKPYFGDGPVLYACDYGFCEGAVIWQGIFNTTKDLEGVQLVINGGEGEAFI